MPQSITKTPTVGQLPLATQPRTGKSDGDNKPNSFIGEKPLQASDSGEYIAKVLGDNLQSKKIEKFLTFNRYSSEFEIDKELNRIIVVLREKESGDILRQIPTEVDIKLQKHLRELIKNKYSDIA